MFNSGLLKSSSSIMPSIGRMEYEELIENDIVYVGTPDTVGPKLEELYRDFLFDELIIISHYGGLTREQALRTQQLFADYLMPRLRDLPDSC